MGFGVPGREFWLGLDNMYYMTNAANYGLRVKLVDVKGRNVEYNYKRFKIVVSKYKKRRYTVCCVWFLKELVRSTRDQMCLFLCH